jgi:hypothetical protein
MEVAHTLVTRDPGKTLQTFLEDFRHVVGMSGQPWPMNRTLNLCLRWILCALTIPVAAQERPAAPDVPRLLKPEAGKGYAKVWFSTSGACTFRLVTSSDLKQWNEWVEMPLLEDRPITNYWPLSPAPTTAFFQVILVTNAPVILAQPEDDSGTIGTPLSVGCGTEIQSPSVHTWYRDGIVIQKEKNPFMGSDVVGITTPGRYWVVVSNPWGTVTSRVARISFTPPVDLAAASISGRSIEIDVWQASFPFQAPALYRLDLSAANRPDYVIDGLIGVPDSKGTYSYTKNGMQTAVATFNDSITGVSQADLVFETASSGTFTLTKPGLSGRATGRFSILP